MAVTFAYMGEIVRQKHGTAQCFWSAENWPLPFPNEAQVQGAFPRPMGLAGAQGTRLLGLVLAGLGRGLAQ